MADQQVAVLIDYENVGLSPIQWLLDQISDVGRVIVKRAYADWSATGRSRDQLLELGIEPVHLFRSSGTGKNSSDIRLAIDAIDLLYQSPVDTFVIVSSDSDFVPLANKLRSAGKTVIGAGVRAAVSRTLVTSCDRYFYLEPSAAPRAPQRPAPATQAESLLVRAIKAAMDDQGRVPGSRLRQAMQRLDPGFDFKALGHSTFSKYLEASEEVKVTRSRGQGDIMVELAPQAATSSVMADEPTSWWAAIDAAWSQRAPGSGQSIPGPTAAASAAAALGVPRLSSSRYKTLQRLLDVSDLLRERWLRAGNRIVRR